MLNKDLRKSAFLSLALILSITLSACSSEVSEEKKLEFQKAAKEQFDVVQAAWDETGELDSIVCDPEDCRSKVYFNFNKLPIEEGTDLEGIMRLNTATFSNLEWKIMGSSHTTLIAKVEGKEVLSCTANDAIVDECKEIQ